MIRDADAVERLFDRAHAGDLAATREIMDWSGRAVNLLIADRKDVRAGLDELARETRVAIRRLQAMRELHSVTVDANGASWCVECRRAWPCATRRALDS